MYRVRVSTSELKKFSGLRTAIWFLLTLFLHNVAINIMLFLCFFTEHLLVFLKPFNLKWFSPENVDLTSLHYICNLPRTLKANILLSSSQPSNKLMVGNSQLAWTVCFQEIINFPCGKVNQGYNRISTDNLSRWLRDYFQFVISEFFGVVISFPIFACFHSVCCISCTYVVPLCRPAVIAHYLFIFNHIFFSSHCCSHTGWSSSKLLSFTK